MSVRSVGQKCRSEVWIRNVDEKGYSEVSISSVAQKCQSEVLLEILAQKFRSEVLLRSVDQKSVDQRCDQKCRSGAPLIAQRRRSVASLRSVAQRRRFHTCAEMSPESSLRSAGQSVADARVEMWLRSVAQSCFHKCRPGVPFSVAQKCCPEVSLRSVAGECRAKGFSQICV